MRKPDLSKKNRKSLIWYLVATLYLFSTALAVTYTTDSSNGPETLSEEVTASFEAWKDLDTKLEVTPSQENPESKFQYGTPERFSPDMLSVTVQRQQETRQLIHLISPNAENRQRILLHEAGIAIGLSAQSTPALATPVTEQPSPESETGETAPDTLTSESTDGETTDATSESTSEETTTESSDTSDPSGDTSTDSSSENTSEETENTDSTQSEDTSETTSEDDTEQNSEATPSETTSEEASGEEPTATSAEDKTETTPLVVTVEPWKTVMNPSINPDDKAELGEGEKELLKALNLFAKEDINKDGNINFYDLVAIAQALGQRNVNDPSDFNKDGIVDQADVDILRKVYTFSDPSPTAPGQTEPSNPEGQTGPEDPEQTPDDTITGE